MKEFKVIVALSLYALATLCGSELLAQPIPSCGTNEPLGSNLVCNGDFEQGDVCFTTQYTKHSTAADVACGSCFRNWSNPDEYEVVTNVITQFHTGFTSTPNDHTPTGTNHFMAVDGSCSVGKKVWSETVTVFPSTNYFFTMWYTSLHSSNPALLQFDINGTNVGLSQQLTAADGIWQNYTFTWASGATSGPVVISIENITVTGCGNGNDFAIDDISFSSGCLFGAAGPQPNLGPDVSLCVNGGTALLNSGVTPSATMNVTWSTGATGTGVGAPYTLSVSSPGTYSVCVRDGGSCIKSDVIVVTNIFTVNLGPDVTLCNPTSAVLDAGITATGISYQWQRNGVNISGANSRTYTASSPAIYRVNVTIPGCGTQFDDIQIFSNAAVPNDANFCPPAAANLSVTGTGTYEWYATPSGPGVLATGNTYSPTPAVTTTYYVKDAATFSYNVGPTTKYPLASNDAHDANHAITFDASTPFTLVSATVYGDINTASAAFTIGITLRDNAGAVVNSKTVTLFAPPVLPPNPITVVVPIGFNIPVGTGYRLSAEGTTGTNLKFDQNEAAGTVAWPFTVPGVISLTGLHPFYSWLTPSSRGYGYFYNWEISAGVDCQRVPVVATLNCPAPVTLVNFDVTATNANNILVSWQTAQETDSDYFTVERSFDGVKFNPIRKIKAAGNSTTLTSYSINDAVTQGGVVYYRLVQYDFDRTPHLSEVQAVNIERNTLTVYPNPGNGLFQVSFDGVLDENIKIEVINHLGQTIYSEEIAKTQHYLNKQLDLRSATTGIYYLKVQSSNDRWIERIVKE